MSFIRNTFAVGSIAEADKININFLEIYEEIENFPSVNGALATDSVSANKIQDGAVVLSKLDGDLVLTSSASIGDASDDSLVTSKAITDYMETL